MSLKRAYELLALFYTGLIGVGGIALFAGGGNVLAAVQLGVGIVAVIGLWGYVRGRGHLGPRLWHPFSLLLAAGAVGQVVTVLAASPSATATTWQLISAIFFAIASPLLYRYGEPDQDLWASPEALEAGRRLDELLEARGALEAEQRDGERQARVRLQRAGTEYRIQVERQQDGGWERFEASFRRPASLAAFLETYTCVTVADIVEHQGVDSPPGRIEAG